jgi:hypothetical protein
MINLGHLDINVVTHCNNRCASCSHASPFTKAWQMTPQDMFNDLMAIKPFLHFGLIQLVGGEPLLHSDLRKMIWVAKQSHVSDMVTVTTNGRALDKQPEEFWQELQGLQISIYPGLDVKQIEFARAKVESYSFALYTRAYTEFYQQFKATPDDGRDSFKNCHWKSDCYTLHRGKFYLCPQSCFFPHNFMGLPAGVDGLDLEGLTQDRLDDFLNRKEPFHACRICLANRMVTKPWVESKTREAWLKDSTL